MAEQPLSPEEGFASILERYEKMVYGFALARTGSRADADDVFQEVFLAYFQCGKHFREEEHRRAWLLRTTLNFSRRVTASPWRRRVVPLSERADAPVQFQTPEQTGLWSPSTCSTLKNCPPRRSRGSSPSAQARCGCACPGGGSTCGSC